MKKVGQVTMRNVNMSTAKGCPVDDQSNGHGGVAHLRQSRFVRRSATERDVGDWFLPSHGAADFFTSIVTRQITSVRSVFDVLTTTIHRFITQEMSMKPHMLCFNCSTQEATANCQTNKTLGMAHGHGRLELCSQLQSMK